MKYKITGFFAVAILLLLCNPIYSVSEIMSFNDVMVGNTGYGKTVFHGVKIEKFNIKIAGKFANTKLENDLLLSGRAILIEITGETVESYGGISSGMSGSPIYIQDKIIGGISATWKTNTKVQLALVTPIEDMLKIIDYPVGPLGCNDSEKYHIDQSFEFRGKVYSGVNVCSNFDDRMDEYMNFLPVNSMVISDMKITETEKRFIKNSGLYTVINPGSFLLSPMKNIIGKRLEEGSSFGIQLVRGDFNITALGTVTYLVKDKMVGLGHSMLKKGAVNYFFTSAYIYKTVPSQTIPYRLGVPMELIGSIVQDRETAVLGLLKVFPSVVPVKIECTDIDLKKNKTYIIQIVDDPDVLPVYLRSTLTQALEQTSDRIGKGSVLIETKIRFTSSKSSEIKTLDVKWNYFDDADFTSKGVNGNIKLLTDLLKNRFSEINILDIYIKTRVQRENRTIVLDNIDLNELENGDFEAVIKLSPYKKIQMLKKIQVEK
ncbi:hypothetical protein KAJ27_23420 [bacterium]|nr:hypothetical protein [bacterium]